METSNASPVNYLCVQAAELDSCEEKHVCFVGALERKGPLYRGQRLEVVWPRRTGELGVQSSERQKPKSHRHCASEPEAEPESRGRPVSAQRRGGGLRPQHPRTPPPEKAMKNMV